LARRRFALFFTARRISFVRFAKLLFEAIDAFFERLYIFFRRRLEIQSARDGGLLVF
jgi:hypothetical protein